MIVPVSARIERRDHPAEAFGGLAPTEEHPQYEVELSMFDTDTGEVRAYSFWSLVDRMHDPYEGVGRIRISHVSTDDVVSLRRTRDALSRFLDTSEPASELERVKQFVREASPKDVGAVMGTCLSVLDEKGQADIVTLLRELVAMVERMVDSYKAGEGQ